MLTLVYSSFAAFPCRCDLGKISNWIQSRENRKGLDIDVLARRFYLTNSSNFDRSRSSLSIKRGAESSCADVTIRVQLKVDFGG